MSKFAKIASVVILLAVGVVLAQVLRRPAPVIARTPDIGRYRVVAANESYLLYDTSTGLSWVLMPTRDEKSPMWVMARRSPLRVSPKKQPAAPQPKQ